jgi:hypothetical protein
MLHAGGSIIDNNPKVEISGNTPFHFEVLHFSTSILGFLHFSQDFYAGFYKMVDPTVKHPLRSLRVFMMKKNKIG